MPDLSTSIREYYDAAAEPVDVPEILERSGHRRVVPNWAVAVAAALAVFVLIGGFVWLVGGNDSNVVEEPTTTVAVETPTTVPDVTTTTTTLPIPREPRIIPAVPPPAPVGPTTTVATAAPATRTAGAIVGEWNPILSTTVAGAAHAAATCPEGTNPAAPGPIDQARPTDLGGGPSSAAFDQRAGRVVYVHDHLDDPIQTWTFDVCTSTWHQMLPTGVIHGLVADLVYDVDSDVTVALEFDGGVFVYDANTNTWTHPPNSFVGPGDGVWYQWFPGATVYDPVTGLIITAISNGSVTSETSQYYWEFWAYDVDTNEWIQIGPLDIDPAGQREEQSHVSFLGYSEQIDRFIVAGHVDGELGTILVDPGTGDVTVLPVESRPIFNPSEPLKFSSEPALGTVYVTNTEAAYVADNAYEICGFDPTSKSWTTCFDLRSGTDAEGFASPTLVGDPINNRLILMNNQSWDPRDWGASDAEWADWVASRRVGAIDLATGEWIQLLGPSTP